MKSMISETSSRLPLIFDGHNDILSLLYKSEFYKNGVLDLNVFASDMPGHLDMKKNA